MKVILDSTALIHFDSHLTKMKEIYKENGIKYFCTTRINYLELLARVPLHRKNDVRKSLNNLQILEFDKLAQEKANKLAMQHQVSKENQSDFMIAAIAIANKLPILTENNKDFNFTDLKVIAYRLRKGFKK